MAPDAELKSRRERCTVGEHHIKMAMEPENKGPKDLPSNAGFAGSIPGWGIKISHAVGQQNLLAITTEPRSSRALRPQLKPTCNKDPVCHA